jgi:mono/diheme cytochrome c family protein
MCCHALLRAVFGGLPLALVLACNASQFAAERYDHTAAAVSGDREEAQVQPARRDVSIDRTTVAEATSSPVQHPPQLAPDVWDDPILARGQALFLNQCVVCHGDRGDGQGQFAYLMNPRPRNLQQGRFKLATTANQIPSDTDLVRTITWGMPGSAMPPWGHLPKSDIEALVQYVRHIHITAVRSKLEGRVAEGKLKADRVDTLVAGAAAPGLPLYVPPEPSFDDVRWFRGRRIYIEACAACHGVSGAPVEEAVKFDSEGYPVPPRSFVNGIFKGGSESHQLYARIIKGLKGTPMPSYEGTYSNDEIWDLIHYVQSLARKGAQDRAQLKQETIVASRIVGTIPTEPLGPEWERARPVYVALTPLWWNEERIEGLIVQALHNGEDLAIRMSWLDPTPDDRAVRQHEFRDAVAIQFSLTPDPPFYMGNRSGEGGVNIWLWKADRQKDLADGYQDVDTAFPYRAVDTYPEQIVEIDQLVCIKEWPRSHVTQHDRLFMSAWGAGNLVANPESTTSVESLVAHGPGTLESRPASLQHVKGSATYSRGVWYVQMERSMAAMWSEDGDDRVFEAGDYLPLSFAIWNGSAGDRDGKKNLSIWQKLVID